MVRAVDGRLLPATRLTAAGRVMRLLSLAIQNRHSNFWIVHEFRNSDSLTGEEPLGIGGWVCPRSQPKTFGGGPRTVARS